MFNGRNIEIEDPSFVLISNTLDRTLYAHIYGLIVDGSDYTPIVDCDQYYNGGYGLDLEEILKSSGVKLKKKPSKKASNPDRLRIQFIVREFLSRYPMLLGLVQNVVSLAELSIDNAEILFGSKVNGANFIDMKRVIDQVNRVAWNRICDVSESQSGTSTLGQISETLLNCVFADMVDEIQFFKVSSPDVQSYGDFVMTCLPNNLWISVKSNFARERLLASGYSNDILGVGFFEESAEFTSMVRIRNFQRAGFLAMYCPDVAVTEKQVVSGSSTYHEVEQTYSGRGVDMPRNINGQPFIRKLSDLYKDLSSLLSEKDIRRRTTVKF